MNYTSMRNVKLHRNYDSCLFMNKTLKFSEITTAENNINGESGMQIV